MTLDEALSLTIVGYRVRHDGMAEGDYINYNFDGFKRNGKWLFYWDEDDFTANWEVLNPSIDKVPGLCQTLWDVNLVSSDIEEAPFGINKETPAWLSH